MIVTVVAVMCQLVVARATIAPDRDCTDEEVRVEEIVTDSNQDPNADFQGCMISWPMNIAKWKAEHPIYHSDKWRLGRVKCVPGHYEIGGRA